jgi:hypothetical protein
MLKSASVQNSPHAVIDRLAVEQWEASERGEMPDDERDAYREAAQEFLRHINATLVFIVSRPNLRLALWQVAFGMNLAMCDGLNMDEKARELGVSRAALSKGARDYQRGMQLPMAEGMRDSAGACAEARERQLSNV